MKYPLGKDLHATVKMWQGFPKIHIRKFLDFTCTKDPGTIVSIPIRQGVALDLDQFKTLLLLSAKIIDNAKTLYKKINKAMEPDDSTLTPSFNEVTQNDTLPPETDYVPKKSQGKRRLDLKNNTAADPTQGAEIPVKRSREDEHTLDSQDSKSNTAEDTLQDAKVSIKKLEEDSVFKTPMIKPRRKTNSKI